MTRYELQIRWVGTELVFLEPPEMDEAILGVCERFGQDPVVAYDRDLVIRILAKEMGLDNAVEWFGFNTIGSWIGDQTPCFIALGTGVN